MKTCVICGDDLPAGKFFEEVHDKPICLACVQVIQLLKPKPTRIELDQATMRLLRMDKLSPMCDWANVAPSQEAIEARERYNKIMGEQVEFEKKYY